MIKKIMNKCSPIYKKELQFGKKCDIIAILG